MLGIRDTVGLPKTVLADTGYASGPAVKALKANRVEPLVAIERTQPHRPTIFGRHHLRGIKKAATEWRLITLACNCGRIHRLHAA